MSQQSPTPIATYYMRDSIQDIDCDPGGNGIYALGWSALYRLKDLQGGWDKAIQLVDPNSGLYCSCFAGSEQHGIVVVRNVRDNSLYQVYRLSGGVATPIDFQGQLTALPSITRNNVSIDKKGVMYIVAANSDTILYSTDGGVTFQPHDELDGAAAAVAPGAALQTVKVGVGPYGDTLSAFIGTDRGGVIMIEGYCTTLLDSRTVTIRSTWNVSYDERKDRLYAFYDYEGGQGGSVVPYSLVRPAEGGYAFYHAKMDDRYTLPYSTLSAIACASVPEYGGMFFLAVPGGTFQSILLEKLADCIPTSVPDSDTTNGFIMSMYQYDGILYVGYMNPAGRVDAYREVDLLPVNTREDGASHTAADAGLLHLQPLPRTA